MTLPKLRRSLYRSARLLGHVQAVKRRRVGPRVVNVGVGRVAGRVLGKVWR